MSNRPQELYRGGEIEVRDEEKDNKGQNGADLVRIGLLGPMSVTRGGLDITPSAPKLRKLLALLVLNSGTVVHVDRLVEELWEQQLPPSALATLQTYIYQIRKALTPQHEGAARDLDQDRIVLITRPQGYELQLVRNCELDLHVFESTVSQARQRLHKGAVSEAAQLLRTALALWRGPALDDIVLGPLLSVRATQLEESRKAAHELRIGADLQLGRHPDIVNELAAMVLAEPTHEAYTANLMIALHRCGRRTEALQRFRRLRDNLVSEFGLEPSAHLQKLHQRVLADDPQLLLPEPATTPAPAQPVSIEPRTAPAQLPPDIPDFVGHADSLAVLERLVTTTDAPSDPLKLVEIVGRPGVGKTAFMVRAAHRLRKHFPGGQLHIDLTPVNQGRATMRDVLASCLRSCTLPAVGPESDLLELSSAFRSWTADRRILLTVDDALDAKQLLALQPSGPGSVILATSRTRLHGLRLSAIFALPALNDDDALALLRTLLGADRVDSEPSAALRLVRLCEGLPLALCAATALWMGYPERTIESQLRRLEDRSTLLGLPWGGSDLRESVLRSYRTLPATAKEAFRVLGSALDNPLVTPTSAALALDVDHARGERIVEQLADSYLVERVMTGTRHSLEGSYWLPDLVRAVGVELQQENRTAVLAS